MYYWANFTNNFLLLCTYTHKNFRKERASIKRPTLKTNPTPGKKGPPYNENEVAERPHMAKKTPEKEKKRDKITHIDKKLWLCTRCCQCLISYKNVINLK